MDKQTDRRMNGRTDGPTDGRRKCMYNTHAHTPHTPRTHRHHANAHCAALRCSFPSDACVVCDVRFVSCVFMRRVLCVLCFENSRDVKIVSVVCVVCTACWVRCVLCALCVVCIVLNICQSDSRTPNKSMDVHCLDAALIRLPAKGRKKML